MKRELEWGGQAARAGGAIIADRWGSPLVIDLKGEVDLVTEVDLASEAAIVAALTAAFPDDAIRAEEGTGAAGVSGRTWVIDPLDGTTNFSHGLPHFCVSIALVDEAGPLVGVVYEPIRRWTFAATRGGGATLDGRPLSVSRTARLDRALLATGFPYDRRTNPDDNVAEFSRALKRSQGGRRAGSAALDLAYLAAGWLDGYWESRLKPWDLAAGVLLVAEAGGKLTAPNGGPFDLESGEVAASNGAIHAELLACLEKES